MSKQWRMSLRWQDTRWVCQSDNRSSRTGGTMRPSAAVIPNKWVSHCRGKIDLATLVLLWAGPVWPSKIKRSVPVDKMNTVMTLEKFSSFQPVWALNPFTLKSYTEPMCEKDAEDPVCKSLFTSSLIDLNTLPHLKNKPLDRNRISHTLRALATLFSTYYIFGHFPLQVVYRQAWNSMTSVLETNKTSVELQIPTGENYLIEIKALTEGGDGTSSGPFRIPKMSSKFQMLSSM